MLCVYGLQAFTFVIPSAGVGFLALPGIGNVAKVAGVISVQCSLGSLILGVYYARQHQRDFAKNAVRAI
jgi:hypothetical protein